MKKRQFNLNASTPTLPSTLLCFPQTTIAERDSMLVKVRSRAYHRQIESTKGLFSIEKLKRIWSRLLRKKVAREMPKLSIKSNLTIKYKT